MTYQGYAVRDAEKRTRLSGLFDTRAEAERRMVEIDFNGRVMEVYRTSLTVKSACDFATAARSI